MVIKLSKLFITLLLSIFTPKIFLIAENTKTNHSIWNCRHISFYNIRQTRCVTPTVFERRTVNSGSTCYWPNTSYGFSMLSAIGCIGWGFGLSALVEENGWGKGGQIWPVKTCFLFQMSCLKWHLVYVTWILFNWFD